MDKCTHSVYCVPADWQAQEVWKVPVARRVSWHCWWCRSYGDDDFSLEKLHRLAMANCQQQPRGEIRETDTAVLIKNADYDLREFEGELADDGGTDCEEALEEVLAVAN